MKKRGKKSRETEVDDQGEEQDLGRALTTPPVEQLLIEQQVESAARVGTLTVGRGQLARHLANAWTSSSVECLVLDSYHAERISEAEPVPANLTVCCAADWPSEQYDLVYAPLRRRESAELNRDLLQDAFHRLRIGGELIVGIDSLDHPALLAELREWARPVAQQGDSRGSVFRLRKEAELKRIRNFRCEVVLRDRERLLKLVTRPGVFSHRQLDPGARQILKAIDEIRGRKLLDLGCGSGAIAVALAARDPGLEVWAVDSHARAVEATRVAAELNELNNLQVVLTHTAEVPGAGTFDLVTCNPPYFADFEIARRFLDGTVRALKSGGDCILVTKLPNWYREHAGAWLEDVETWTSGNYHLVRGRKA